jgi:hypothetical protein
MFKWQNQQRNGGIRFWFERLQEILFARFGEENWIRIAAAWASAQEINDNPRENMKMVLNLNRAIVTEAVTEDFSAVTQGC